jgi:hypothetical protein
MINEDIARSLADPALAAHEANVAAFCVLIARIRREYEGSVISWGRSPGRNADVGGNPKSLHMLDLAVDVQFPTVSDANDAFDEAYRLGLHGYKKSSGTGLHLQMFPKGYGYSG